MSEREVYWRGMLDRQAQSGLSVAEFCQRQGLASPSFYVWRKRLREREQQARGCVPGQSGASARRTARQPLEQNGRRSSEQNGTLFVPLTLAQGPNSQAAVAVEIERPDGMVLRVFDGARRQLLEDVLAALERQP